MIHKCNFVYHADARSYEYGLMHNQDSSSLNYATPLSDIAMPNEDGYSLLHQIRQIEDRLDKSTPVIAVTALGELEARFPKSQARFDQWLLKPVDIDELIKAIAHLTGRSILLGELTSSY
ncbi:MAG: response regulator [Nostoc sp.]|uniref:response regulator n=1 Tax=Nostoc sp. TaxID=1180 RepID=UPI002FF9DB58